MRLAERTKHVFELQDLSKDLGIENAVEPLLKFLLIDEDREMEQTVKELLSAGMMRKTLASLRLGRSPSLENAKGDFELGRTQDSGFKFGLRDEELSSHVLIAGITGSGKTTTALRLMYEWFLKGKSAIVFDWKGDYTTLLKLFKNSGISERLWIFMVGVDGLNFNPLRAPDCVKRLTWIETFTDMFIHAFGLREPSASILVTSLKELYEQNDCPTLAELRDKIEEYRPLSSFDKESQRSILTRLRLLTEGTLSGVFLERIGISLEDLLSKFIVLDLSRIPLLENKRFLIEVIYGMTYEYLKARDERTKTKGLFIIEEAHNVFGPKTNFDRDIMSKPEIALCEMRDFGWGTLVIDQQPSKLSSEAVANTATKICHKLARKEDQEAMANAMGLREEQAEYIGILNKGEVFAKFDREDFPYAFHAQIQPIAFTGEVKREEVEEYMRPFFQNYQQDRPQPAIDENRIAQQALTPTTLEEKPEIEPESIFNNAKWLQSVKAKVTELDENSKKIVLLLGQGASCKASDFKESLGSTGKDFKQSAVELAKNGLIGFQKPKAVGKPVIYFLRPEGLAAFHILAGKWPFEAMTECIKKEHAHSEMKECAMEIFAMNGWRMAQNKVEHGYADLCLTRENVTIPIEICTGSNKYDQVYHNVLKCIKAFGGVYFICENRTSYNAVLQQASKVSFDQAVQFLLYIILYENFLRGEKFEKFEFS